MAREIYIQAAKNDCFVVISKKLKNGKIIKTDRYNVDLRNYHCPCKGFWYHHKCEHINSVIQILRSKGISVIFNSNTKSYYTNWDYQDIEREIKNEKIVVP